MFSYLKRTFQEELSECFGEFKSATDNLAYLSQQILIASSRETFRESLISLFSQKLPTSDLHNSIINIIETLRNPRSKTKRKEVERLLITTSAYDETLEQALKNKKIPFHVVSFVLKDDDDTLNRNTFWHFYSPKGSSVVIDNVSEYENLISDNYPIILKIYGGLGHFAKKKHSFVISEDDYIKLSMDNYLSYIPEPLPNLLVNNPILFIGYNIRNWNYRIILSHIFSGSKVKQRSWAIQDSYQKGDKELWDKINVELINNMTIEEFFFELRDVFNITK